MPEWLTEEDVRRIWHEEMTEWVASIEAAYNAPDDDQVAESCQV